MKTDEYREMSDEQRELALKDELKNLFHLRFQSATERLETPSELRKSKREIARIMTLQREEVLLKELLGKLPAEEATRVRGLEPGRRLNAAQAAAKKLARKGK